MSDQRDDAAESTLSALTPGDAGRRWRMLGLLFLARAAMAFQCESVAALAPPLRERYGLDLGDIGFLVGLYLAPGIVLALPGGAVAARYGEKSALLVGLVCMLVGGGVMALTGSWSGQI